MKTDCASAVLAMRPSDKIDLYILDSGDGYFLRIVKVVVVVKRIGYKCASNPSKIVGILFDTIRLGTMKAMM